MGGAQAIAALAYGTESVEPVAVIVGPGNLYVQEAKRQVFGQVGIDGFAGPSDLLVIADAGADAEPLALDLLAQAEHGPGTLAIGISTSADAARRARAAGSTPRRTPARWPRSSQVGDAGGRAAASRRRSRPEHLQLVGSAVRGAGAASDPRRLRVRRARAPAPPSATTSRAPTTCCRRTVRRGSHRRCTPGHFLRSFSEVRIRDGSALARCGRPGRARRGVRAPRPVDGGPHSRQWRRWHERLRSTARPARRRFSSSLALDGDGAGERSTGVGFLDHMLDLLARHGHFDLNVRPTAISTTGAHHTVEDVGICIGQALDQSAWRPRRDHALRSGDSADGRGPRVVRDRHLRAGSARLRRQPAAGRDRQLRPRADRGVPPSAGDERKADAARDRRDGDATSTT